MTAATRARTTGKRPEIEAELKDKYKVEYAFKKAVPLDEFDVDASLKNQARFVPVDEATVELYKEAVERGDVFPAVLAHRPGRAQNAKLVIIDGNHRLVAHQRAGKPIDVYEIERGTRGQTVALMTFAFNTKHGRPTSEAERVSQALYLIENGASQENAAAAVNVSKGVLRKAIAKANADKRADEVGIDRREWEGLAQTSRARLLNVSTDEGFHGAAHLAYIAKLDANEVFDLVTLLNTSKSAGKQRQIVRSETERYKERIDESAGGVLGGGTSKRAPMTPKARVGMLLGQVLALPEDVNALARGWADGERAEAAGRILDASERLRKLALTLDASLK